MRRWYDNCSIFSAGKRFNGLALKQGSLLLVIAVLAGMISGCGKKTDESGSDAAKAPLPTAATLGDQVVLTAEEYLAAAPYDKANSSRGERLAQICKACHSFGKGQPHMIGPALHGFFGAQVGSQSGFEYSAVMRNADFVWTPAAVDAWLAQPGRFLPGNRMMYAGLLDEQDRNDLIAYLLEATTATK
jgi:cytochrome c